MPRHPGNAEARPSEASTIGFTDDLVAWDDVIAKRLQLAFDDVQIRPAHAAGADAKQDLAGRGNGNRDIADFERAGGDARGTG